MSVIARAATAAAWVLGASGSAPLFRVTGKSLFEVGFAHGEAAKELIRGFLQVDELTALSKFAFETDDGRAGLKALRAANEPIFPEYVEEMSGIALGANVTVDVIWMINLLQELENLMPHEDRVGEEHCTDAMAAAPGGPVVGHNEDWSTDVIPYVYFMAYEAAEGANFSQAAGLCYPGMIIGNAITFNDRGLYYTQNALFPKESRGTGLAMNFVQRQALDRASSLAELAQALAVPGQALGFSLNMLSVRERRAANLEVYEDRHSLVPLQGNLSHMNIYKHLHGIEQHQNYFPSTIHRQAEVDAFPVPESYDDIVAILGSTRDADYPIYRAITMVSTVVDAATGKLHGWSGANPALQGPMWTWDLHSFFDSRAAIVVSVV